MQWLEGRIEAGLGNRARAEKLLGRVRLGLEKEGLGYQAALAALDLTAILLSQGRPHEARELVIRAAKVFAALGIEREAMGAVLMLRQAFELEAATAAFVEEVAAFLRKIENDPSARFDPH